MDFEESVFRQGMHYSSSFDPEMEFNYNAAQQFARRLPSYNVDFFSNNVEGAVSYLRHWQYKSLYYSHGAAIFEFTKATFTLDPKQLQLALTSVNDTIDICNEQRRHYSFVEKMGNIIRQPNYDLYTDKQAHAELVYAESLLLQASLITLNNNDFRSLVRVTFCIKNAYHSYKRCVKILREKDSWENDYTRDQFESGVRLGVATFNVMTSMLPRNLVAVLDFVGFSGNKEYGLEVLLIGAKNPGLRSVLCSMTLLVHHLIIGQLIGITPDFALCHYLIEENLSNYPGSAWFLMFKGRLELLLGIPTQAIDTYEEAANCEGLWPQFNHLAFWEAMFANAMMGRWEMCSNYGLRLLEESDWSPTLYAYMIIAAFLQHGISINDPRIERLIQIAEFSKKNIRGRSDPMEEFVLSRCQRLRSRGLLILPGIEMLCLWNLFPTIAKHQQSADLVLKDIEDKYNKVERIFKKYTRDRNGCMKKITVNFEYRKYDADDFNLLRYLRGAILLCMGFSKLALKYLEAVLIDKESITNTYLIPYTLVEVAMCHYNLGNTDMALRCLDDAKKKTGYFLMSRLHLRIQAKKEMIRHNLEPKMIRSAHSIRKLNTVGTQRELCYDIPLLQDEKGKKKKKETKEQRFLRTFRDPTKADTMLKSGRYAVVRPRSPSPVAGPSTSHHVNPMLQDTVVHQRETDHQFPLSMSPPEGYQSNRLSAGPEYDRRNLKIWRNFICPAFLPPTTRPHTETD